MKLSLQYSTKTEQPTKAAFIRGTHIDIWLEEINRWKIAPTKLECYVLPESIQSIEPAGLFVIFKDASTIKQTAVLEAYTCIGNNLFIPVHASLSPQINNDELQAILLWELQVFHPTIGLIGFEQKNQLALEDLFFYTDPIESDWSFAHPGLLPKPPFNEINIIQPTAEELIDSIKKEIGQKPLSDIPKNKKESISSIEKVADKIKYGLYKGIFSATSLIGKMLPQERGNHSSNNENLLQQLQNWLLQNIDVLEKKRNDEITRLLNLFNEDTDEALQYAIPLNSPYLNRGSETTSTRLSRNNTNFNLGRLGGGQSVDSWDIGSRYNDLRSRYLNAAEKEIRQKDFKKAAYVYAHLLGDYHGAANVLEQGNMHREAAALYKDHLKNIPAAAECLERGGLYGEAIELYKELNKEEKVGDLYKSLAQDTQAEKYYELYIEKQLSNNDYFDAARVINEKLEQATRAEDILLQGWNNSYQYEPCLKKYFDVILNTSAESTEQKIKHVFTNHTPSYKKTAFLNVLEHVSNKKNDEQFTVTAKDIAYEIVYEEAEAGNVQLLHSLRRFLPDDKLIGSDTSRYVSSLQKSPTRSAASENFDIDPSIQWLKAVWHRNQFLVIGIKNNCLHMARGNWYKNVEYYSWANEIEQYAMFSFISTPYYSSQIILHSSKGLPITRKNLPKNKYFTESLIVNCPIWLHKDNAQFIIDEENTICKLEIANHAMTLHQYTIDGALKKSIDCRLEDPNISLGSVASNPTMVSRNGYYYTYKNKQFISISKDGLAKVAEFDTVIRFFATTISVTDFLLIISTNRGCLLCRPVNGELNIEGSFFAEELIPINISFISADFFVITEKKKAFLFEFKNERKILVKEIETVSAIIAALPASNNLEFALIEADGKITIHRIG